MRTTITIDPPLMKELKGISHREHKTFTRLIQELLVLGLKTRGKRSSAPSPVWHWNTIKSGARVDYTDKEALYKILDQKE